MTTRADLLRPSRTITRPQLHRYLPSVILAGYGIFILSLFMRHAMTLYINPSYVWPSTLAGAALVCLAAVRLRRTANHSCADEACCGDDSCGCDGPPRRLWPYSVLAIPLALAVLVPPRGLAGFSARQRGLQIAGLNSVHAAPTVKHAALLVDTRTFTLQDWVGALSSDPNPKDYMGKPITVSGLALHDSATVPPGYIMVLRYQVTCCIADARPEGLIVKDTSHGRIRDNQWVTVSGAMGATTYQGQGLAVVEPDSLQVTKAGDPYMY